MVRGCALLGILFVNVLAFGLPIALYAAGPQEGASQADVAGWAFIRVGFQYKFIAIFSMLFGVGLAVQAGRAMQRGASFAPVYLRRVGLLALIGFLHASFLWFGDILFVYAILGVGLLLVSRMAGTALVQLGAVLLIVGTLWTAGCIAGGQYMQHATGGAPGTVAGTGVPAVAPADASDAVIETGTDGAAATDQTAIDSARESANEAGTDSAAAGEPAVDVAPVADRGRDGVPVEPTGLPITAGEVMETLNAVQWEFGAPAWNAAETDAYRHGTWGAVMVFRAIAWGFIILSTVVSGLGVQLFGYFCLGAGLLRTGFFDPERPRRAAVFAMVGLPLGLAAEGAGIALLLGGGSPGAIAIGDFLHSLFSPVAALGWLGLITWLVSTGRSRLWDAPLAAAGRMALTVYLGETLLCTAYFYWWGMGRFAEHGYAELVGIAVIVYAVLVVFAMVWLRFFRMGPMEWLWRSATYGRWQALRR
ncbi:MAG: DUF418 domain-containing protein [Phycisphaerales bacterium]